MILYLEKTVCTRIFERQMELIYWENLQAEISTYL